MGVVVVAVVLAFAFTWCTQQCVVPVAGFAAVVFLVLSGLSGLSCLVWCFLGNFVVPGSSVFHLALRASETSWAPSKTCPWNGFQLN